MLITTPCWLKKLLHTRFSSSTVRFREVSAEIMMVVSYAGIALWPLPRPVLARRRAPSLKVDLKRRAGNELIHRPAQPTVHSFCPLVHKKPAGTAAPHERRLRKAAVQGSAIALPAQAEAACGTGCQATCQCLWRDWLCRVRPGTRIRPWPRSPINFIPIFTIVTDVYTHCTAVYTIDVGPE